MNYPLEKYRFYKQGRKIIAVSTYAGRTVRGIASCNPVDEYNEEVGKQIAAGRCNLKIAEERCRRAQNKFDNAKIEFLKAQEHMQKMYEYLQDSRAAEAAAREYMSNKCNY